VATDQSPENPFFEFEQDDEEEERSIDVLPLATKDTEPIPSLRDVRAQVVSLGPDGKIQSAPREDDDEEQGEMLVVLEDPEGLAPKPAALSMWAYAVATLFDGRRSAQAAAEAFEKKYKQPIPTQQILDLQRELDQSLFLYSRRFEKVVRKQIRGYMDEEVRPASHAGVSYPDQPDELHETIDSFFTDADGPGQTALDIALARVTPVSNATQQDNIRALMLPHIDLRQGGATYAHGYAELLARSDADLFFILGVAHHAPGEGLFYVSQKSFATPVGTVKTERSIAARLQAAADVESPMAELAHRVEFSVEFQAVLLASLLGRRKRDFEIVPVLCGPVEPFLATDTSPFEAESFKRFVAALHNEMAISNRRWCVICSVDLSHVGPEFNHSVMMTEKMLLPVERMDKKWLKTVEQLDSRAAWAEMERTQNSRHVDAVLSVLTMLETCRGNIERGKLLHYDQMMKPATHSAVSFASMSFSR
jgi:hypothetical protein